VDKFLHSKWTSVEKINGWRHYEVRNILKKQKKLELFAVCDKSLSFIIKVSEIKNKQKWIAGWKELV